jgi:PAB-dependent poly(A)-specific ribonuclease subunit 3
MSSDILQIASNGTTADAQVPFDPFSMNSVTQAMPTAQYNPYLEDTSNIGSNGAAYYQAQTTYTAPAQPVGSQCPELALC